MAGNLYIVATPIGNLEDITLRAIKTLQEADVIICEDTRVTEKLVDFLKRKFINEEIIQSNGKCPAERDHAMREKMVSGKLISYHQHSSDSKKQEIVSLLQNGKNLALVTDAGTPGISDPGNELIAYCLLLIPDLKVVPIPGPSAIASTLSVSGLDINKFVFLGFMPKKKRTKLFIWLKEGKMAFAYYDSPYRTIKNLKEVEQVFGANTQVFVARELTKIHETLYRGTVTEVIQKLNSSNVKGEVTVVVNHLARTVL